MKCNSFWKKLIRWTEIPTSVIFSTSACNLFVCKFKKLKFLSFLAFFPAAKIEHKLQ